MKKKLSTFFSLFCFFTLLLGIGVSTVTPVLPCSIYGKVLRLHVLANSDSQEDQDIKLLVRDGLLCVTQELFYGCTGVDEALRIAGENTELLEKAAIRVLRQNKSKDGVRVVVGKERYPERTYGGFTFPKGEYLSLRVLIGEGKGRNWWCVLFPPLCNAGVENPQEVLISHGMDKEDVEKLKTENDKYSIEIFGCRVKLKILELFK